MNSYDTTPFFGRLVDPQSLEALGKQAARTAETGSVSMTEAVVQTIGHTKLSSEQVRRVCEFANIEIFNRKFAGLQGTTRAVHFDGGPADPSQVLQSLNDAARPREVTMDSMEYSMPPDFVKSSGASVFDFAPERTRAGALGEIYSLQSKLAAAHDELVQNAEAAKERLSYAFDDLVELVKSASAGGATPSEIYSAWHAVHPELAKLAFERMQPLMRADNEKIAGRSINPASRLVSVFSDFVKESQSAKAHTDALRDVETNLTKVSSWLRTHGG